MPQSEHPSVSFTSQQGQYLRFLFDYIEKHGKVPSQSVMSESLRLSSASAMLKTLESKGLISREPGDPQSLKILVPAHLIPPREGGDVLPFLGKFGETYPNLARWIAIGGRLELGLPTAIPPEQRGLMPFEKTLVRLGTTEGYVWASWHSSFAKSPDELLKEAEEQVLAFFPESPPLKNISSSTVLYQLKVTVRHSQPAIWRRLVIPAELPLSFLHKALQASFSWDNSHLHGFRHGRVSYGPVVSDTDEDDLLSFAGDFDRDEQAVALNEVLRKAKDKLTYEYDYGDSWEHEIVLEKLLPNTEGSLLIRCTDGKRAAPIDDCGGIYRFERLVEAYTDPKDTIYKEAHYWLGKNFDPDRVDLDAINKRLTKII